MTCNYHEIGKCDYNVYVLHTENILFCLLLSIAKSCKLYKLFCSQSPCDIKYFLHFSDMIFSSASSIYVLPLVTLPLFLYI